MLISMLIEGQLIKREFISLRLIFVDNKHLPRNSYNIVENASVFNYATDGA